MGIHEFICRATKGEEVCLECFDLSKSLEKQKKELEKEYLQKEAMNAGLILCYNQQ